MKTVCVFGDAIIDRDVFVRITGSAGSEGVTAHQGDWEREHLSLGGAGRAASIVAKTDKAMLYAPIGGSHTGMFDDIARGLNVELPLMARVGRDGITFKHRIWDSTRPTDPRLLLRYDQNEYVSWDEKTSAQVYDDLIPDDAVLCVVDHGKGCCNTEMKRAVMKLVDSKKRLLIVDPGKDTDLIGYTSPTTIFKFNGQQAQRYCAMKMPTPKVYAWDKPQPEEDYIMILDRLVAALRGIVYGGLCLTLGGGGMIYAIIKDQEIYGRHFRCKVLGVTSESVKDTCGAGDAVMASLACNTTAADLTEHNAMETIAYAANKAGYTSCFSYRMDR